MVRVITVTFGSWPSSARVAASQSQAGLPSMTTAGSESSDAAGLGGLVDEHDRGAGAAGGERGGEAGGAGADDEDVGVGEAAA